MCYPLLADTADFVVDIVVASVVDIHSWLKVILGEVSVCFKGTQEHHTCNQFDKWTWC